MDNADSFVSYAEWKLAFNWPIIVHDMQIGMATAATQYLVRESIFRIYILFVKQLPTGMDTNKNFVANWR